MSNSAGTEGTNAGDDTDDPEGESLDPRIEAGWRALDAGDIEAARASARLVVGDDATVKVETDTKTDAKTDADADAERPLLLDGLLLLAACAREEGQVEEALEVLARAGREDPDWCTPALWTAELLAGDPEQLGEALKHARRALDLAEEEDEFLAAIACKAAIELDLDRPKEARKTLRELPAADLPLGDPLATLELAELLIDAGDPGEARVRLQTLIAVEPQNADAWYLLGAVADMTGDENAKRAAWERTRGLDLEAINAEDAAAATDAPRLSEDDLVAVAEETLAGLPEEVRVHLKNVPIVVADLPAAADVATGLDPRLLGLFSGTPHSASGAVLDPPTLTEIILFRRNIERVADDEDIQRDEVRTTLLHEAGHFFGLDEAALTRLGLD